MNLRRTFALVSFCLLSVCYVHPISAVSISDPIVVGVIHSEAHPAAQSMKKAFDIAVEVVNKKVGIKGRPLELAIEEDGLRARGAIGYQRGKEEKAIKSLADRSAALLIGGYSSTNTIHTAHLAEKFGIPFLVTTAADDQITQRRLENVYRLNPPAQEYGRAVEEFLLKQEQPKSMVIVYEASPYGTGTAARMASFCRDNDIEVRKLIPYQKDRISADYFENRLRRLQQDPPDVVFMVSYLDDAVLLVKTLQKLNVDSLLIGAGGGFVDPRFVETLGASADGILTAALWSPEMPYAGAREFHDAYVKLHSEVPSYHGAEAYAAVFVAADALERADDLTPEAIREALDATDLETPFGQVRFRSYGTFERQNKTPTVMLKVANSKLEFAWPEDIAASGHPAK